MTPSRLRTISNDIVHERNVKPFRTLSLIIPFYNERSSLPLLLGEIERLARRLQSRQIDVEAVLVDDGSTDGGGQAIAAWVAAQARPFETRVLRLSRNFGKELALSAGLEAADADAVVLLDADLQHPVELIDTFVEAWLGEGVDVVYAYREDSAREPLGKRVLRSAFYRLVNGASGGTLHPSAGDFRLMSRRACEALKRFPERERLMKGLYGLIGFPTKGVPYAPAPRAAGTSKFPTLKLWAAGLNGVTAFSVFPLRLTLLMGLALGLLSFVYGVWTVIEKLAFGIHVPGYPTLVVIISMVGAGQLIGMGIVGEYVGKVLVEVKQRPLYILESDERLASAAAPSQDRSLTA
ncbi:MAG: glycosyltransferase family 2 protein [Caulobacteraceae bacterium]|nr:glycosyltransferase family 2 protein [Caulobacteraceae bacterium]